MFFQLFLGGRTLNTMPSEKGSRLSTSSSSASPPNVIIYEQGIGPSCLYVQTHTLILIPIHFVASLFVSNAQNRTLASFSAMLQTHVQCTHTHTPIHTHIHHTHAQNRTHTHTHSPHTCTEQNTSLILSNASDSCPIIHHIPD